MTNFFKHHFWISLIVVLVVVLSLYAGFSSFFAKNEKPKVEFGVESVANVRRVEPLQNSVNIGPAPDFIVYFGINIKAEKVKLKANPKLEFEKSNREENQILFRPKEPLLPNKNYTLIVEIAGKDRYTWQITTKNYSVGQDFASKVNLVKNALPYNGTNIKIAYLASSDKFYADIPDKEIAKYKSEVNSWFASKGLADTTALNIIIFPVNKF